MNEFSIFQMLKNIYIFWYANIGFISYVLEGTSCDEWFCRENCGNFLQSFELHVTILTTEQEFSSYERENVVLAVTKAQKRVSIFNVG